MTGRWGLRARWIIAFVVLALLAAGGVAVRFRSGNGDIVVGRPGRAVQHALPGPTVVVSTTAAPAPVAAAGSVRVPSMRWPDASPYGEAVAFDSNVPVPDGLLFVLVVGSDARPGERLDRSRADSIHLVALNPRASTGTVLGIPRDTWVEIPGHGRGKINNALALGGIDLLSSTMQRLTGLPVDYWVLTGFEGFQASVDAVGGIVVPVERRMADSGSGAFFEPGWHRMIGRDALAFSRDRKDVPNGDFGRSNHQGVVLLSALAKMRVEVRDMAGVRRWVSLFWNHVQLRTGVDEVVNLAATARRIDPRSVSNVVAPGRPGYAGSQSVVYLTPDAAAMFNDLRDDATIGQPPSSASSTSTTVTTTTTTTSPPRSSTTTTTAPRPIATVPVS
jgi:polyisoprenyl-teichoic acid--peptidoglycan teichoic acid transferase